MSRDSFEALIDNHPESKRALRKIRDWFKRHPREGAIYPRDLATLSVDSHTLADALEVLINAGVLRRVYKVRTPEGGLSDDDFGDPRDIPQRLPNRFEEPFDTADRDIVPIFKRVA